MSSLEVSGFSNFYPRPPRGGRPDYLPDSFRRTIYEFLSTPSARRATCRAAVPYSLDVLFLSTPSARRATLDVFRTTGKIYISIHALREEGDLVMLGGSYWRDGFLSTPSARRVTSWAAVRSTPVKVFLSTPSARRATIAQKKAHDEIREFLSTPSARRATAVRDIVMVSNTRFLSTPSARRATRRRAGLSESKSYFYPRPPRGGRPVVVVHVCFIQPISIHALREEGDTAAPVAAAAVSQFLSTPSARRATLKLGAVRPAGNISIHALREEGDAQSRDGLCAGCDISIHALREEGDKLLPMLYEPDVDISIHALREEGDPASCRRATQNTYFYPRPPRGGRRTSTRDFGVLLLFLSTPSARRATSASPMPVKMLFLFLSTPSARRATGVWLDDNGIFLISIHALREEGDQHNGRDH